MPVVEVEGGLVHRSKQLALVLLLFAAVSLWLVVAGRGQKEHSAGLEHPKSELPSAQVHSDRVSISTGQLIDQSEAIVVGQLIRTPRVFWNSTDETGWLQEFQANPDGFPTAPVPIVSATFRVRKVMNVTEGYPISDGDTVVVWLPSETSGLGDAQIPGRLVEEPESMTRESLLFLDRRSFWLAGPAGARNEGSVSSEVWAANPGFAVWDVNQDVYMPFSLEHYYQLVGAGQSGFIPIASVGPRRGVTEATLQAIIEEERKTPTQDSYASFASWPWEPAYRADALEDA